MAPEPGTQSSTGISENGRVSTMAHGLIGSEILKIAADIRALQAGGTNVCNLTVGDFSTAEFRIPAFLEDNIKKAYTNGETNYPPSDGILALRKSIVRFYADWLKLEYPVESVLVTGGSRPGITATYMALVDPGDIVVYPVPSWNNNHYCHLVGAQGKSVACGHESAFLPTATQLKDVLRGARLLALNSPLNPTGTAFSKKGLEAICDLVLEENARRKDRHPLYVMYDQVYWLLTFGSTIHENPVSLRPEMSRYTIFVDGISKPFAATGVRVGWVVGPQDIVARMMSIVGHIGAWAPRAEQVATSALLDSSDVIKTYHKDMKSGIQARLDALYNGISAMRKDGFPVDAIPPAGAIYLSARFALNGKRPPTGEQLDTNEAIRKYLLQEARIAVVPFQAFGTSVEDGWFRLSVGAVSLETINAIFPRLRTALQHFRT